MVTVEVDKKKAQVMREYGREIAITVLMGCVGFLFLALGQLNNFIRTDLMQLNIKGNQAIENSTNTMKEWIMWQKVQSVTEKRSNNP